MNHKKSNKLSRIEQKEEVITYLERLVYSLKSGQAKVALVKDRHIDRARDEKYTNRYTFAEKNFKAEDFPHKGKRGV